MENREYELEQLSHDELVKISLLKNKCGNATDDALLAQKILYEHSNKGKWEGISNDVPFVIE